MPRNEGNAKPMTDNAKRCGAKTRRGTPCQAYVVRGRERCRMHGGMQKRGLAHHNTTHGRFSKDLPTRLAADYETAIRDPELIALRNELALVTAREADLVKRLDSGEAGQHWQGVRKAVADFRRAQQRQDTQAAAEALRQIERLTDLGIADYRAWSELLSTIESRRRLAETERRRLEAMQQTITSERAMLLVGALVDAVRRHVDDRAVLDAIGREVERVVAVRAADGVGGVP
jgi:hypothetical protein